MKQLYRCDLVISSFVRTGYTTRWVWLLGRIWNVMKHYFPTGRRNYGRPLKRLLDTWHLNGSSGPTPWEIYDDNDDDDDDGKLREKGFWGERECMFIVLKYRDMVRFVSWRKEKPPLRLWLMLAETFFLLKELITFAKQYIYISGAKSKEKSGVSEFFYCALLSAVSERKLLFQSNISIAWQCRFSCIACMWRGLTLKGDRVGNWRTFLRKFDMFSNYRNCLFQWRVRNTWREVISWQKGSA